MVRFSSNVKRPKAVVKHNNPLISKEAPSSIASNAYKTTARHQNHPQLRRLQHQSHAHTRSLPSNSQVSVIQEIGLSSSQAIKKLIEEIDRVLTEQKRKIRPNGRRTGSVLRYLSLVILAGWSFWKLDNWQMTSFYILILVTELFFIEFIEKLRAGNVVSGSIKTIRNKLRKLDKSLLSGKTDLESVYRLDFKVPASSATSYTRVIRDGKIRLVCLNLLVPGDFVVLLAGEKMSAPCQPIHLLIPVHQKKLMGLPLDASIVQVEGFPVAQVFEDQLSCPRRTRFIFTMLQQKFQSVLWIGIVFMSNSNAAIPLTILSSPILHFFWWFIGSCYLSLLADQLIRSKTPFKEAPLQDSTDVDEFDEDAPPPVKNIKIPGWKVGVEVLWNLFKVPGGERSLSGILRLWDGDVIEALALTSVLCFSDREGPISNSHSRPCELIVPTTSDQELVAIELIPTISDPQRVRPSLNNGTSNANDLRAIGLSMLLSADCGRQSGSPHCRHENILKGLGHFLPEHLQTCYCNLAKEIGFDPTILNRFKQIKTVWHQHINSSNNLHNGHKHVKKTSTVSILLEDQLALTVIPDENDYACGHLFTFGEVSDILKISSHAYSKDFSQSIGSKITGLSDSLKRKLIDFEGTMRSCDVRCVAFSYRPIFEDERLNIQDPEYLIGDQVFLGLISVCPEPKEHFQEFIDDLEAAGVRFAYFSPYREQPSKAFGERLGLETDWNSCILLSEHPNPASQSPGYSALSDIKARLPRGIQAIRPHLESVDDIPLHVSIFAECNNQNSSEMMKIYQESGEVVSLIGSCRSIRNSKCFGAAHFSIGSDPFNCTTSSLASFDQIALDINAGSVKLILPADSSPYILTELIRESRTILQNSINAWEFLCGSLCSLILVSSYFKGMISFYEHVVLVAGVLISALAIVMGPFDDFVMKTHPTVLDSSKCPTTTPIQFSFLFSVSFLPLLRFLPSPLSLLLICLLFKDVFIGTLLVLLIQAFAFCHTHENLDFKRFPQVYPKLFVCFTSISLISIIFNLQKTKFVSILITISTSIVLGLLCLMWHETIKSVHLKDYYDQAQKRAKLLFNTKLGMHSPV